MKGKKTKMKMMKRNGIFCGIGLAFFVIMTFEVSLSKGEDDPSSEHAAEEDEMKGPVDNLCYVCKARGQRRRGKNSVLQNCLHVSTSDNVQKVMCQHGCMAAYGVFRNSEESIERWCVGGNQMEQELIDLFAVVKTRRLVEKMEGSMYSCDKVYFDDDSGTKENAKKTNSSDIRSRDPVSYNFCWCRGNECNGRQINGFIRAGASGRKGGGGESGRMVMTFAFALIFGVLWIPGSLGAKVKCSFCTERTHSDCFEGGKDINTQLCDPVVHYTNSCIKMQTCVSGLPCEIYRGCEYKTINYCLGIADVAVTDNECSKRKFKLNTPWGSTTFICLHSLKTYFEKRVWDGKIIKPSSDFDDEDELKATNADGAIVEVEYCHCSEDNCNGGLGVKGKLGVVFGLVGFGALMEGRHAGKLMTWLFIMLTILTMVSGQSQNTNTTNTNGTTSVDNTTSGDNANITFDCFKCSDSKTSCYYSYLEECPSIDISKKYILKNTKYQDKSCGKNSTRLCKALTTQHILGGGAKETEKGCLDSKELDCFQETFQLNVAEGDCAEKYMGYEEYTKWLRCNVKNKVKITTNYNEGVVNIMEELKDFYGEDTEKKEFFVKICTCNADTSKGCNYNLN